MLCSIKILKYLKIQAHSREFYTIEIILEFFFFFYTKPTLGDGC